MSIFEIRHYNVKDGRMAEWIGFMEDRIVPFMISNGMDVNAMFESDDDENLFIWIRRFDDDDVREEQYEAVYESEEWQSEIKPGVRSLIDVEEIVVHRARATPKSPMR